MIKRYSELQIYSLAKSKGYTIGPVYHGTDAEFNKFNLNYFGKTDRGFYGIGFYFTPSPENAKDYGKLKSFYLKINNPFILPDAGTMGHLSIYDARDKLADLYNMPELKTIRTIPQGYHLKTIEHDESNWGGAGTFYAVHPNPDLYDSPKEIYGQNKHTPLEAIISFHDDINEVSINSGCLNWLLQDFDRDSLTKILAEKGYDGLIIEDAEFDIGHPKEYIVWNPEQIKSTARITKDDSGNVIPLSNRMDSNNPDVRY